MADMDGHYNGVAICFEQIGLLNLESGNLEAARKNINRVLDIHKKSGSEYGLSNAYNYLGKIEYYFQNYEKAENYLTDALVIKKEINGFLSLPGIYEYIGLCQVGKGQINEGISNIEHGLELALLNDQIKIQLEIYANLEDVYLDLNDFEKQIEVIDEWQKNYNNPGHFIYSQKAPLPQKKLLARPIVMLALGIVFLFPTILNCISNFDIQSIFSNLLSLVFGIIFFISGITKLIKKSY